MTNSSKPLEHAHQQPVLDSMRVAFPFRLKLLLLTTLLSIVPVVVVGFALVDANARTLDQLSRSAQLAAVSEVAQSVSGQRALFLDGLGYLARTLLDEQQNEETALRNALALVASSEHLEEVGVYDANGAFIDAIREPPKVFDFPSSLDEEFRRAAQSRGFAVSQTLLREADKVGLLFLIPLDRRSGAGETQTTGYLAGVLNLEDVQNAVEGIAVSRFPDVRDAVFVVDAQGRYVAHADREHIDAAEEVGGMFEGLSRAAQWSGKINARDGTERLVSVQPVAEMPLVVVAQIPTELAFASLRTLRWLIFGIAIIAAILAAGFGLLFANRLTQPIRNLVQFALRLAGRDFGARIEVRSRDELALLGSAFNHAAQELLASEERSQKEIAIRTDLSRYMPKEIVDRVVRREQPMELGGERKQISVLFADVVNFTPLTEKLAPETTVAILNELFTILTSIVFRHGGTVDKFIGDSVMALFGAPEAQDDHAARALATAEEMMRWLETGNASWSARYGIGLQLAIGVNSGECVVGNVGSKTRMEYTAIGDVVNVAARLEAIARPGQILLSTTTKESTETQSEEHEFTFRDVGEQMLVGKKQAIHLWQLDV